jgi:hypothetical protein
LIDCGSKNSLRFIIYLFQPITLMLLLNIALLN